MNLQIISLSTVVSILFLLTGCYDDSFDPQPEVITENVIMISGESIIVSGRILSTKNINVVDHGFEISTIENFNNAIIISLGAKNVPGQFIGISNELTIETNYFIRAFIELENGMRIFGNQLEFFTLTPGINSFSPQLAQAGQQMTIYGRNFTSKTEIYFGNRPAEIINITAESVMKVIIPNPEAGQYIVKLRVVENNKSWELNEDFEYVIGSWEQLVNFPFPLQLNSNIYTELDNTFYFGQGKNGAIIYNQMWKYDPSENIFESVDYSGNHIQFGRFTFEGGFGGGISSGSNSFDNSIWLINEDKTAFEQVGNLFFPVLMPVSILRNDVLWILGGLDIGRSPQYLILNHDLTKNEVRNVGIVPFEISNSYPYFMYQDKLYVFNQSLEMWQFDFETIEWTFISQYPGVSLLEGKAKVIDNTVYVGLPKDRQELFKFNLIDHIWKPTVTINDFNRNNTNGVWVHNDKLYVLRRANVFDNNNSNMVMWIFNPDIF